MNLSNSRITKIIAVSATFILAIFVALALAFGEMATVLLDTVVFVSFLGLAYIVYKLFEMLFEDAVDNFMENRERKERKKRIAEFEKKS